MEGIIGTSGMFTRDYRRKVEQDAASDTRATLRFMAKTDAKLRAVLINVGLLDRG